MGRAQVVIGVDVGTTATKAIAFKLEVDASAGGSAVVGAPAPGRQATAAVHAVVREYPLLQPAPGQHVQDPEAVLAAVLDALAACVRATGDAQVLAVSLSAASHGLVALDDALRPLTPLLTWADGRAGEQARRLRAGPDGGRVYAISGTPVHPMTPLTKLLWFGEHEPKVLAAARWWADLKAFVVARLTGTVATDLSCASTTGLLDVTARDWSSDLAALAGVDLDRLPPVLPTTARLPLLPDVAAAVGLPVGCPLVVGAADGPLGNLGTGATGAGEVSLSLGTSGAARVVVPGPTLDPQARLFCYALTADLWVLGGAISNGGSVARWAGALVGAPDAPGTPPGHDDDTLALAEAVPPGSEGLVVLPSLLPERAPLWDPDLSGAVLGLRAGHTRGHLVRAAVEGVALQLALVVDDLHRLVPVSSVRATGGVFRSSLWRQVVADALGRPVTVCDPLGGSALGAAALAVHALGLADDLTAARGLLTGAAAGGGADAPSEPTVQPEPTVPSEPTVQPDPDGVAALDRVRASVRPLLEASAPVAALLETSAGSASARVSGTSG